jgi:hypothetical protein
MKKQDKYNDFICGMIPESVVVGLLVIRDHEGRKERFNTVLGGTSKRKIKIEIKSVLSRSLQIQGTWDDKSTSFILFCPLNKSPDEVFRIFSWQLQDKVCAEYTDGELIDFETEMRTKWNK